MNATELSLLNTIERAIAHETGADHPIITIHVSTIAPAVPNPKDDLGRNLPAFAPAYQVKAFAFTSKWHEDLEAALREVHEHFVSEWRDSENAVHRRIDHVRKGLRILSGEAQ